jgi:hypothetical protein
MLGDAGADSGSDDDEDGAGGGAAAPAEQEEDEDDDEEEEEEMDPIEKAYIKTFKDRIKSIYKVHAPEKVKDIGNVLKKYKGKEPQLLRAIEMKYGVQAEVGGGDDDSDDEEDASKPASVAEEEDEDEDEDEDEEDDDEEEDGEEEEEAEEEDPAVRKIRRRVLKIYSEYAPENAKNVPDLMQRYKGKEEALLAAIETKYGVDHSAGALSDEEEEEEEEADAKSEAKAVKKILKKIKAIYKEYAPEKVADLPSVFEKYAGKETKLLAAVMKKYNVPEEDEEEAGALKLAQKLAKLKVAGKRMACEIKPKKDDDGALVPVVLEYCHVTGLPYEFQENGPYSKEELAKKGAKVYVEEVGEGEEDTPEMSKRKKKEQDKKKKKDAGGAADKGAKVRHFERKLCDEATWRIHLALSRLFCRRLPETRRSAQHPFAAWTRWGESQTPNFLCQLSQIPRLPNACTV